MIVAALVGGAYLVPGAERFRLLSPKPVTATAAAPAASDTASAMVGEATLVDETTDRPELAIPEQPQLPRGDLSDLAPSVRTKAAPVPIEDPSGHALESFFASLVQVERKAPGAVARILHYGDSLLAIDYVSGTLRRKLQAQFGDAGHGYMPIANPWPGYFHNDVVRKASTEWTVSRVVGPFAEDNLYGLGGVSFIGRSRASWSRFATTDRGSIGQRVSRFVVQYLQQPGGGSFELIVDDKDTHTVSTEAAAKALASFELKLADAPHSFDLRVTKGPVRAFGVWMERDVPGVVLDSIGIQGGRLRFMDQSDDAHWAEALRTRNPNLVVFEFGLNEAADGFAYPMERYRETSRRVLEQVRQALPKASCLVVAPNDTAIKRGSDIVSRPVMPQLVKAQRDVAHEVGCAFFDTYQAMGGAGSMPIWVKRGLGNPDLSHPTAVSADIIGTWLHQAIANAYATYRESLGAPAAPASAPAGTPAP